MKKLDTKFFVTAMILSVAVLQPALIKGQFKDFNYDVQEWHHGKVVLASGDSLVGTVTYHPIKEVVQVASKDGMISSFSPVNVSHFIVNDVYSGRPQIFRSLFWNLGRQDTDFKKPVFFEQLNYGTLSLIKRQVGVSSKRVDMYGRDSSEAGNPQAGTVEEVKEAYYALLPDGEIVPLRKVKRDLHQLFGNKSDDVKAFVKTNKLDYNKPHELITIVNYFNSL